MAAMRARVRVRMARSVLQVLLAPHPGRGQRQTFGFPKCSTFEFGNTPTAGSLGLAFSAASTRFAAGSSTNTEYKPLAASVEITPYVASSSLTATPNCVAASDNDGAGPTCLNCTITLLSGMFVYLHLIGDRVQFNFPYVLACPNVMELPGRNVETQALSAVSLPPFSALSNEPGLLHQFYKSGVGADRIQFRVSSKIGHIRRAFFIGPMQPLHCFLLTSERQIGNCHVIGGNVAPA